ncbi:MAG: hypothetical protein H0U89_02315 [Acidimicrobiia bacterium]|nr:hypothetical protein [Acidimicrobiia bacterium]
MEDLAEVTTAWLDEWWDAEAGLLWNPAGSFGELVPPRTVHLVPQSAWGAIAFLVRDGKGDVDRAVRAFEALVALQYDEPGTPWHGTYARFAEAAAPTEGARVWVDYDPNWRQFLGTAFCVATSDFAGLLPASLAERLLASVDLAVAGEPEGRVSPSYSNIALMKAWVEVERGRVEAGEDLARKVVERFDRSGAFEEHGSPTYYGIDLYALALWRSRSASALLRAAGERVEGALWEDVARTYHAGLHNLAGPYTRAYGMDLRSYVSVLGLCVWAGLGRQAAPVPDPDGGPEHAHDLSIGPVVAHVGVRIPETAVADLLAFRGERTVERVIAIEPRRVATAWLGEVAMVGAESSTHDWRGWEQYHPATVHWRAGDDEVGWARLRHAGPVDATAGPWSLVADCGGDAVTTFSVRAPGIGAGSLGAGRWTLPGLDVEVRTSTPLDSVAVDGDTATVTYAAGGRFELSLRAT